MFVSSRAHYAILKYKQTGIGGAIYRSKTPEKLSHIILDSYKAA